VSPSSGRVTVGEEVRKKKRICKKKDRRESAGWGGIDQARRGKGRRTENVAQKRSMGEPVKKTEQTQTQKPPKGLGRGTRGTEVSALA